MTQTQITVVPVDGTLGGDKYPVAATDRRRMTTGRFRHTRRRTDDNVLATVFDANHVHFNLSAATQ